jgi:hypothetical protein
MTGYKHAIGGGLHQTPGNPGTISQYIEIFNTGLEVLVNLDLVGIEFNLNPIKKGFITGQTR